jgi:hypothetical protein
MATALAPEKKPFINKLVSNPARAEIESKATIESLELLHYERRQAIDDLAPLELLFGSGGDRWESMRARHRDGIAKLILAELEQAWNAKAIPGKIAVGPFKPPGVEELKRMANSDSRHVKFCDEQEGKYVLYMHAKNRVAEIEDRIQSRLAELGYVRAELRLQ